MEAQNEKPAPDESPNGARGKESPQSKKRSPNGIEWASACGFTSRRMHRKLVKIYFERVPRRNALHLRRLSPLTSRGEDSQRVHSSCARGGPSFWFVTNFSELILSGEIMHNNLRGVLADECTREKADDLINSMMTAGRRNLTVKCFFVNVGCYRIVERNYEIKRIT